MEPLSKTLVVEVDLYDHGIRMQRVLRLTRRLLRTSARIHEAYSGYPKPLHPTIIERRIDRLGKRHTRIKGMIDRAWTPELVDSNIFTNIRGNTWTINLAQAKSAR